MHSTAMKTTTNFSSFPVFRCFLSIRFMLRVRVSLSPFHHSHPVYDQIIGIVDYENIQIFGITCALAWQLPHNTIEPFASSAKKPLHNENITVTATAPMADDSPNKRIDLLHLNTYYNRRHYNEPNYGNDLYSGQMPNPTPPPSHIPFDFRRADNGPIDDRWNDNHRIYPALRMRRYIDTHDERVTDANIHPDVSAQLKNHRDTRFQLYRSIEKYLDG